MLALLAQDLQRLFDFGIAHRERGAFDPARADVAHHHLGVNLEGGAELDALGVGLSRLGLDTRIAGHLEVLLAHRVAEGFLHGVVQRVLLKQANKFLAVKGKAGRQRPLPLGAWRWVAAAILFVWLAVTIVIPLSGIVLRAFVNNWGEGVILSEVLTLDAFRSIWEQPHLIRGVFNTLAIGVIGGGIAVVCYTAIGLATHRKPDGWSRLVDYMVLVPRAVPGLLAGLAFFWVFLFFPPLKDLRTTLVSVWIAYSVVWLAYGMRLISSALLQVGPELEEAARTAGATQGQVSRHVTLPLIRFGLLASWLLVFMIFEREYSTGVYLLSPGTEVIGALIVSLWSGGAIDLVAALSLINVLLVGIGLAIALRFGVNLHD